jgi:ankyrin repeat protein
MFLTWQVRNMSSPAKPLKEISLTSPMRKIVLSICFAVLLYLPSGCSDDIHSAAKRGDVQAVRKLLAEGSDLTALNKDGKPVLWMAVRGGNIEVVKLLLDAGADPSLQDPLVGTPLHLASGTGQTDIVELLLDRGADINALSNRSDDTPIWEAVRRRRVTVVRLLLDRGADPNHAWADDGSTILHMAAGMGNREMVTILIRAGMNINACDNYGHTPLYVAASGFFVQKFGFKFKANDVMTLLVEHGADLYHRDKNGETPLEHARRWKIGEAVAILERLQKEYPQRATGTKDIGKLKWGTKE